MSGRSAWQNIWVGFGGKQYYKIQQCDVVTQLIQHMETYIYTVKEAMTYCRHFPLNTLYLFFYTVSKLSLLTCICNNYNENHSPFRDVVCWMHILSVFTVSCFSGWPLLLIMTYVCPCIMSAQLWEIIVYTANSIVQHDDQKSHTLVLYTIGIMAIATFSNGMPMKNSQCMWNNIPYRTNTIK